MNHTPLSTDRQIRVFISSTFRDMMRERDLLVKEVFPELRRKCAKRFVTFTEVDLRWGITEEQANEGQVLPLCLAEIERSRPYFIGLLGQRYGWVPDTVRPDVIEREPWLKEHVQGRISVTELEILHGVLNNPKMADHAYFYFRDPAYVDDPAVAREERDDMVEHNILAEVEQYGEVEATHRTEERKAKLAALKQRIRDSRAPLVESYVDPQALAAIVRKQFDELIDRLYPEEQVPDPLLQERMAHEAHARDKLFSCIDRPEHLAVLNAFAAAVEQPRRGLVITGESGSGKTALLAAWARDWTKNHPEEFLFQHYFGATPESASPEGFLRRLLGELKSHFGIQDDIPSDSDKLRDSLPLWLAKTVGQGRVVFVLDGLNQLEGDEPDRHLRFVPRDFPPHVTVLASALPGPALDGLRDREWREHELPLANEAEIDAMAGAYLAIHARTLEPSLRRQLVMAPSTKNPLFLRTILEELRQFGSFERLPERVTYYLEATNPKDLFQHVLVRWQEDFDGNGPEQEPQKGGLVRRALSYLWAARQGLSESEWLELLGTDGAQLPRAFWTPLFLALEPHLSQRGGLFAFGHEYLRQAVEIAFMPGEADRQQVRLHLANYFKAQAAGMRKVVELPWQLQELPDWQQLAAVLADSEFLSIAWESQRFAICGYWATLEGSSPLRAETSFPPRDTPSAIMSEAAQMEADILATLGHLTPACTLLQRAVEQWNAIGDLPHQVHNLKQLATWHLKAQQFVATRDAARELASKAQILGDTPSIVVALEIQAEVLWLSTLHLGNPERTRELLEEAAQLERRAEHLCRETGLKADLARLLGRRVTQLAAPQDSDLAVGSASFSSRVALVLAGSRKDTTKSLRAEYDESLCEFEDLCEELHDVNGLLLALRVRGGLIDVSNEEGTSLRQANLREQMHIAEQIGDPVRIGELIGELADHLPPTARLAELAKQESLWRRIGYRPGLAQNLLSQAVLLFETLRDRSQAKNKCAEACTLVDAFPSDSARIDALFRRVQIAINLTPWVLELFGYVLGFLAAAFFIALPFVLGGLGWLLWSWASHTNSAWFILTLSVRILAIGLFIFVVLTSLSAVAVIIKIVILVVLTSRLAVALIIRIVRRLCQCLVLPMRNSEKHEPPSADNRVPVSRCPHVSNEATPFFSTRAGRINESFNVRLDRIHGWVNHGWPNRWARWQRHMIYRLRLEAWRWRFFWWAVLAPAGWLLFHATEAQHEIWWIRTIVAPLHVLAELLILVTACDILASVGRRLSVRPRVALSTRRQRATLYKEIVISLALLPLRLRRLFLRRRRFGPPPVS